MTDIVETEKEMEFGKQLYKGIDAPAPTNPLDVILSDPDKIKEIDADKIEKLFELQQRSIDAQAKRTFYSCLTAARTQFRRVKWNKPNEQTRSRYATLDAITSMLDPIISEYGFSRSLTTDGTDPSGETIFVLVVRHEDGHSEESRLPLPIDDKGIKGNTNKTRLHGMGSAFTYAERILVTKFFGIETGDKDDDGNAGAGIGTRSAATLSTEQQAAISAHLERSGRDEAKFLQIYGVPTVAEIPAACFNAALSMLKKAIELREGKT